MIEIRAENDRGGESPATPLSVVVAPVAGRLRHLPPRRFRRGAEVVERGQELASIAVRGADSVVVRSPATGRVGAMLCRHGEPVAAGQALLWVIPDEPAAAASETTTGAVPRVAP